MESIDKQISNSLRYEIIVADNNSSKPLPDLSIYKNHVTVVYAKQRGAGPARNAGVSIAKGQYLAFVDCDCILHEDFISGGFSQISHYENDNVVLAGEIVFYPEKSTPNAVEAYDIVYSTNQRQYAQSGVSAGGNLWTSRSFFEQVGHFRSKLAEDTDWCERASSLGAKFYFGDTCIVYHPARSTYAELKSKWQRQTAMSFNKWRGKPMFFIAWPLISIAVTISAFPHSIKAIRNENLNSYSLKFKAIRVLFWCRFFRSKTMLRFYLNRSREVDPVQLWKN